MTSIRSAALRIAVLVACLQASAAIASAQAAVEITPFGGYRFGGDFFELLTRQPLDLDGAPAFGLAVDVPTPTSVQFEALFSHQEAHVSVPEYPSGPPVRWQMTVEHYQAGGLREFDAGRVRPFLTGMLGLTRYATQGDNEVRFGLGVGGGAKLFPSEHLGLRLESRLFSTFVDADAGGFACSSSSGVCFVAFRANVLWQMEFTAGLIVRFP
jgi:hypothetical protein